jgi:hypothetical protein
MARKNKNWAGEAPLSWLTYYIFYSGVIFIILYIAANYLQIQPSSFFNDLVSGVAVYSILPELYGLAGVIWHGRIGADKVRQWRKVSHYFLGAWIVGVLNFAASYALDQFSRVDCGNNCGGYLKPGDFEMVLALLWVAVPLVFWLKTLKSNSRFSILELWQSKKRNRNK